MLLLKLVRELLNRTDQDSQQPIPVVFTLSTWTAHRKSLSEWLVDELIHRYNLLRETAQTWVDNHHALPLLDGLDEVAPDRRTACINTINDYLLLHGDQPLVICSCHVDDAVTAKLQRYQTIVIQPLSRSQIHAYLDMTNNSFVSSSPAPNWDILDTPLLLSMAAILYDDQPSAALAINDPRTARDHLLTAYIDHVFQRDASDGLFTEQDTHRYLAYLAWTMKQHHQTVFYLEQLQPSWLPSRHRWLIQRGTGLVSGLGVGLVVELLMTLIVERRVGLMVGLTITLVVTLSGISDRIEAAETVRWSAFRRKRPSALIVWLIAWLLGGLVLGLGASMADWLVIAPGQGLIAATTRQMSRSLGVTLVTTLILTLLAAIVIEWEAKASAAKTKVLPAPHQVLQRISRQALLDGFLGGI